MLTITMANSERKNAGSIPGIMSSVGIDDDTPSLSHIITVSAPVIIPTIAPCFVVFFHHSDSIISGPNAAASPPHAKATRK